MAELATILNPVRAPSEEDSPIVGRRRTVGVVTTFDFALDDELWRWMYPHVVPLMTRMAPVAGLYGLEFSQQLGDPRLVQRGAQAFAESEPDALLYHCASGSFIRGWEGERRIREALLADRPGPGAAPAFTSSGAMIAALQALDVRRLGLVTPYDNGVDRRLTSFLEGARISTTGIEHLRDEGHHGYVSSEQLSNAIATVGADPRTEAVFVACTAVATFDILGPLEQVLAKPVLSTNQASAWAVRTALGPPTAESVAILRTLTAKRVTTARGRKA